MDRMASKSVGTAGFMAWAIMNKVRSINYCLISSVAYASSLRFLPRELEAFATYLPNSPNWKAPLSLKMPLYSNPTR